MHRTALQTLLMLALLVLPASSAVGRETSVTHRLYYYFDPGQAGQLARATAIHRDTGELAGVEWLAVTRAAEDIGAFSTVTFAELSGNASLRPVVALWLQSFAARPDAVQDHILVENRVLDRAFSGPGTDAARVIAAAGLRTGAGASTDVDFTTWGKVKDLFR